MNLVARVRPSFFWVSETHQTEVNLSEQRPVKRRATAGDIRKKQEKLIECAQNLLSHTEESSAESYGRAIGLQLKEMTNIQRCIAEKMISEVIFYGKLEKLSLQSSIFLNNSACSSSSSTSLYYQNYSPGNNAHSPTYSSPPPISNSTSILPIHPSLQHYPPNPADPSFSLFRPTF